jgi:pantoate--beta-alanine ligase
MKTVTTVAEIRHTVNAARKAGRTVGLVPTMGALHAGHASLIERSTGECGFTVVSIFVNPAQFGPTEDLDKYPRTLDADLQMCEKAGVDAVFTPENSRMYPPGDTTWVSVEKLTEGLCGALRPGHFRGVTTVCAKLFNIVMPDKAYFGQKDGQQAVVVKRMVEDLKMPLEIVVCPTVRESGGLAASSRNRYLSPQERKDAALLYKSLSACRDMIRAGTRNVRQLEKHMRGILAQSAAIEVEYASVVDAGTLEPLAEAKGKVMAAAAVKLGAARLIDNVMVDAGG